MVLSFANRRETPVRGTPAAARRASAAVEFAVVAPLLAALMLGMCEMGRVVMIKDLLTDAARKGCRTGVMPGKSYQNIVNDINDILSDHNIPTGDATITVQIASYTGNSTTPSWGSFTTVTSNSSYTPGALDKVSVQVSIPATDVLWFAPVYLSKTSVESETLVLLRQG